MKVQSETFKVNKSSKGAARKVKSLPLFVRRRKKQMKWEWETSTGLIKSEGEMICAVFGASVHNVNNREKAFRNARLIENAPEMYSLLDRLASGEDIQPSEITALLKRVNGGEPDKPELKRCPFCGGEAEVYTEEDEWWHVRCSDCWAQTDGHDTEIGAIDAWNQRKQ